jgi:hypothetical protein
LVVGVPRPGWNLWSQPVICVHEHHRFARPTVARDLALQLAQHLPDDASEIYDFFELVQ